MIATLSRAFSSAAASFTFMHQPGKYIQRLIFDAGVDPGEPPVRPRRRVLPLTPEDREARQRRREKLLRRQLWIIPDAKPPKKPKKSRRRKNRKASAARRRTPRPRPQRDPAELKRQYKPLGTEIFNLPAGLIDCLKKNRLNLRRRDHLKAAHKILDVWAARELPEGNTDTDEVEAMHAAIDRLAKCPLPIADQLRDIEREFEVRAAEVRDGKFDPASGEQVESGWSQHHRDKVNNYYLPPLEVDRVTAGEHLPASFKRDVIE